MLTEPCGGCIGLGSHRRWCPAVVGARAARLGRTADDLDALGDTLPPDLANAAWRLAEQLRVLAGASDATRQEAPVPFVPTLLPGDRVRFNGHDWSVFISMWSRDSSCWHEAEDLAAILDRLDALADDIRKASRS